MCQCRLGLARTPVVRTGDCPWVPPFHRRAGTLSVQRVSAADAIERKEIKKLWNGGEHRGILRVVGVHLYTVAMPGLSRGDVMVEFPALVAEVRGGDPDAFGQLVDRFEHMVHATAFARLGDAHLAQDAAQEAFMEVYRNLEKLRDPAAFAGWLQVIVYRQAGRISGRSGIATVPLPAAVGLASPDPGPAAAAQAREMRSALDRALASLPAPQRLVTTLYYVEHRRIANIASLLRLPVTTIKKRLYDSRKRLRQWMGTLVLDPTSPPPAHRPSLPRTMASRPAALSVEDGSAPSARAAGKGRSGPARSIAGVPAVAAPGATAEIRARQAGAPAPPPGQAGPAPLRGLDDDDVQRAWAQYKETGGDEPRNRLIEHYLPLIRYHAQCLSARLPDEVDIEDLRSVGILGLVDALAAFDPGRGVKFETFSARRIRGAMFDELRSMDWVPRLVRSRVAHAERARQSIEKQVGRAATDAEIAATFNLSARGYARIREDTEAVSVISLSRKRFETETNREWCEIDVLSDPKQVDPLSAVERLCLKQNLTHGLSRAERLIVLLYYFEHLTMKEIGAALDLSESRVSQMHSLIMGRLRAQRSSRRLVDALGVA